MGTWRYPVIAPCAPRSITAPGIPRTDQVRPYRMVLMTRKQSESFGLPTRSSCRGTCGESMRDAVEILPCHVLKTSESSIGQGLGDAHVLIPTSPYQTQTLRLRRVSQKTQTAGIRPRNDYCPFRRALPRRNARDRAMSVSSLCVSRFFFFAVGKLHRPMDANLARKKLAAATGAFVRPRAMRCACRGA